LHITDPGSGERGHPALHIKIHSQFQRFYQIPKFHGSAPAWQEEGTIYSTKLLAVKVMNLTQECFQHNIQDINSPPFNAMLILTTPIYEILKPVVNKQN
jgi:hypothetical protein